MSNLAENFVENRVTEETGEKEWEIYNNKESRLKDQEHLRMAYEWLKRDRSGSPLHASSHSRNRDLFDNRESVTRNWLQLQMTYEWLRSRGRMTPLVLKRRIWWEPVPEASGYVVYVSQDRSMFNRENFRWEATDGMLSTVVIGKAELILPDEWLEFPKEPGVYYIGVTSRDDSSNESNPLIIAGHFRFVPPPSPSHGGIAYL